MSSFHGDPHGLSHWLDRGSTYGVFIVGSLVITLFVLLATWTSG
jgi:hypothetical protein